MAVNNTPSDAANTAVRAYLTSLGTKYCGYAFNVSSGRGKRVWAEIKDSFQETCAYCGVSGQRLTMDHLVSFNRVSGGLHHPGNVVPCCSDCNRRKKRDGQEIDWAEHLTEVQARDGFTDSLRNDREQKIRDHIVAFNYPSLPSDEVAAICTIANSIYEAVSTDVKRGVDLYWSVHEALVGNKPTD